MLIKDDVRLNFEALGAIFLIAFALSMDAFVVSVARGLCQRGIAPIKNAWLTGAAFGLFQGIMPLIGYFAGHLVHDISERLSHLAALILLGAIGLRMITGALKNSKNPGAVTFIAFSGKTLLAQAVATSADALAVGVSLALFSVNIYLSAFLIACVAFAFSFCGVLAGSRFGLSLGENAAILGGIILIIIGIRIFFGGV